MNFTMSTRLTDLLDQDGKVPDELSARGRNLIIFLGEIVTSVSGSRELTCSAHIQCRKYKLKRRCRGNIAAWCKEKNDQFPIEWCCLECGEGGIIYDWQGSRFDQKELRQKRIYEHVCAGVWINGQRLDEVKMALQSRPGWKGISYLVYPAHRIVVRRSAEVVHLGVPPLLAVELFRREIITPRDKTVTIKLGANDPALCRIGEVRYLDSNDGLVELDLLLDASEVRTLS